MRGLRLPSASFIRRSEGRTTKAPPRWFLAVLLGSFVPLTLLERSFTAGAGQSLWTPALGVVFGIMVLYGIRWVPILIATLMGVTAISVATSSSTKPTDWAAISALVAAIVGGYAAAAELARRVGVRWSLRRLRDAAWLTVSCLLGTGIAIAAALGVVDGFGYLHGKPSIWSMFSQGSAAAGASTVAISPLVLLAADRVRDRGRHGTVHPFHASSVRRFGWVAESVVLAACFAGCADLAMAHDGVYYPMLIPIGWLALRRGIGGTSVGVAVGSLALTVFAHSLGMKPGSVNQLEIFLLVLAVCGLCFGSAQTERRDLEDEAVRGRQALAAREAQLKVLVETLRDQASRDTLTRLPLKSLFVDYLVQAQARVRRTGKLVAVLYLDVDGFKQINDRHGHQAGDIAISLIAERLRQTVRVLDAPARAYEGGDEFLVLCDELSGVEEAFAIADRIASSVADPIELPGVGAVRLTASVGVAFADPDDDPDAVVNRADAAMLAAKEMRRDPSGSPSARDGQLAADLVGDLGERFGGELAVGLAGEPLAGQVTLVLEP